MQQTIRCRIDTCVHNSPDHFCRLSHVTILPCGKSAGSVADKPESMCADFEKRPPTVWSG